jgi:hypothetical protein
MNCDDVLKSIPLYFYGELPPEEEERMEDHLDGCQACRDEAERMRALAAALDRREMAAEPPLLERCRQNLMASIRSGDSPAVEGAIQPPRPTLAERFAALLQAIWGLKQPIGAVALLALGYFSAQLINARPQPGPSGVVGADPMIARVRSVQPDSAGRVQIALDEVRRRVVSGRLDDNRIQQLLLAAARDENDAGVRVESVGILKDQAASADVRAALLNVVARDPNPGVRLKALEGLKSFAADSEVRRTLAQVLLRDDNPGVRIQAIDILTATHDDSVVGVLQNVVGKEDNSYVRWRCEKALKDMNASVGTF